MVGKNIVRKCFMIMLYSFCFGLDSDFGVCSVGMMVK